VERASSHQRESEGAAEVRDQQEIGVAKRISMVPAVKLLLETHRSQAKGRVGQKLKETILQEGLIALSLGVDSAPSIVKYRLQPPHVASLAAEAH
jgi:hypothetical protein